MIDGGKIDTGPIKDNNTIALYLFSIFSIFGSCFCVNFFISIININF